MIEPNIVIEQQPADLAPQNIPIEKPMELTGVKRQESMSFIDEIPGNLKASMVKNFGQELVNSLSRIELTVAIAT